MNNEDIIRMTKEKGYFVVSWRYRDSGVRNQCRGLVKSRVLKNDWKNYSPGRDRFILGDPQVVENYLTFKKQKKGMYSASSFKHELPQEFVIYDLETTGVDNTICEVTEMGAARVRDGVIVDQFSCLVKTKEPIPQNVVELTGITNEILASDGVDPKDAFEKFLKFVDGARLVGHNILRYDNPILVRKIREELGLDLLLGGCIDTAGLFKAHVLDIAMEKEEDLEAYCLRALDKRIKGLKFNLAHAHQVMGFKPEGITAHRVAGDIQMVLDVYSKLIV